MATWERVDVPPDFAGVTRLDRQGGTYLRYLPDHLTASSNDLEPHVLEYAADVSTALARLGGRLRANPLPILYSTSIRSESISSSWIEGIRETPRAVAIAQIGDDAATPSAAQIIRNVNAMKEAIDLLGNGAWSHDAICQIHQDLLPWHHFGYRRDQVWIGGTNKLNAHYAAPPGGSVQSYVEDLLRYANTSGDLPVIQAAVIHAQFETIHPFNDGNGRVGRALVHGILRRSGLIEGGVIPLSSALRDDVPGYIRALTDYRYDEVAGDSRRAAVSKYVEQFLAYTEVATAAAERLVTAATDIQQRWRAAIAGVRSDSSLHRALELVVEHPVVSARFLTENLDVSAVSAHKLLKQLTDAGILKPATGKYRRSSLYQADDILNLLTTASEPQPRTDASPNVSPPIAAASTLVHRCSASTSNGPCRNRVTRSGARCWRHAGSAYTTTGLTESSGRTSATQAPADPDTN